MYKAKDEPWLESNFDRPSGCEAAEGIAMPAAELFLYMTVTKLINPDYCSVFEEGDDRVFAGDLFAMVAVAWVICFLCISRGPQTIGIVTLLTATVPWVFLFVIMGKFVDENNKINGKGPSFYFGAEKFPLLA